MSQAPLGVFRDQRSPLGPIGEEVKMFSFPFIPYIAPSDSAGEHSVLGSINKHLTCCFCDASFNYELCRVATVSGIRSTSPDGTHDDSHQAANILARAKLRVMLEKDIDPVACPSCGKFQPAMSRLMRWHYLPYLRGDGFAAIAIGTAFGVFLRVCSVALSAAWLIPAVLWFFGLGFILFRTYRILRFDPNAPRNAEAARDLARRLRSEYAPGPDFIVSPDGAVKDNRANKYGAEWTGRKANQGRGVWLANLILLGVGTLSLTLFLLAAFGFIDTACLLERCEPGVALVVARAVDEPVGMKPNKGQPFSFELPPISSPFEPLSLRYEREGKQYQQDIDSEFSPHGRFKKGEGIPILFDPKTLQILCETEGSLIGLIIATGVMMLITVVGLRCGYCGWQGLRY